MPTTTIVECIVQASLSNLSPAQLVEQSICHLPRLISQPVEKTGQNKIIEFQSEPFKDFDGSCQDGVQCFFLIAHFCIVLLIRCYI